LKKVCILTSVHPVADTRIFIKQAQSLKKAGYDVTLIAQNDKEEIKKGIKIIPLNKSKSRLERILKISLELYKKALKINADIYHFHDPELIPIALLLKFKGKKVIYDVHEDVPQQILSKDWIWKPIRRLVSKGAELSEKFADEFFDGIISATPVINKKFHNPNSISVQNFPLLSELTNVSNKNDIVDSDYNYITYVGGITSARGIKEMINAVELVPDSYNLKFLLAGKFSSKKLRAEMQQLKGWKKVEFLGWISREKMSNVLSKSKLGLVLFKPAPNHINSQPNKMFEYMSASLPVLASSFPLWEEIIGRNNCGINTDPKDPKKISDAIQYVLDHPEEARRMGQNGRKAVEEKYNWSVEEKKLLNLYNELLED
jgi:glycosyltransferase involved in cell wall biosynthesis